MIRWWCWPTNRHGNLDTDTGKTVLDLLDTLTRKSGKNLVMVTHSEEVVGVADRVYRLKDGKMVKRQ